MTVNVYSFEICGQLLKLILFEVSRHASAEQNNNFTQISLKFSKYFHQNLGKQNPDVFYLQ